MFKPYPLLFVVALLIFPEGRLAAQSAQLDALKLRSDMAVAIGKGDEAADAGLTRLGRIRAASGEDSPDDFAIAATDIAHRLLAREKVEEALKFFRAAEKSLDVLVKTTPDSKAVEKARYLQLLAVLRGSYLLNPEQSKADIEAAIALRPEEKSIVRLKGLIGNEHGNVFKGDTPKK